MMTIKKKDDIHQLFLKINICFPKNYMNQAHDKIKTIAGIFFYKKWAIFTAKC